MHVFGYQPAWRARLPLRRALMVAGHGWRVAFQPCQPALDWILSTCLRLDPASSSGRWWEREPPRGVAMDVLKKVVAKPGWITSHVVAMLFVAFASCGVVFSQGQRTGGPTPSAPGAEVYFIDLKDGTTVPAKLKIYFGLRNMGVAPAGSERENSGHHHLLVDTELPPLDQPIPNDFNHLHFGAGQTETEITLKPGAHTLQLLMGDKDHIPHTPPVMSALIRVRVVDPSARKPAPADARVYFVGLEDGSVLPQKATIHFGLVNMGV